MGRGYPYWKVVKRIEVEFDSSTGTPTGRREEYWCAQAALVGSCGHRHPDEDEAMGCLPDIEARYRAARWPKRKKKETSL
jgi:hypothetical protein